MAKLGPIFRCTGMDQVAATEDGSLAMVEIIEVAYGLRRQSEGRF
jgi:hypothetical protein